jgi:hypothetical protein
MLGVRVHLGGRSCDALAHRGDGGAALRTHTRSRTLPETLTVVGVGRRDKASISMLDRGSQSKALKSYAGAAELLTVVLIGTIFTRLVPLPGIPRDDSVLSVLSRVIAHNEVREPLQPDVTQP